MIRRAFDIIICSLALLILSPFFLIISIAIKINDGGPIIFAQRRVGRNFTTFNLYKFRTMVQDAEKLGPSVTTLKDNRITKVGKILRRTKLDELPQLINILKGDMSIVGPRPEIPKYVNMFKEDYKYILTVKPGLTDYATLEFRDEEKILSLYKNPEEAYLKIILPKKLELSKKYVMEKGLLTDSIIILRTIKRIIFP